MIKRFTSPPLQRLSAVAIAAALAAFAGVASAQSARTPQAYPGFVVDSSGNLVRSASGECVRTGNSPAGSAASCPPASARTAATGSATRAQAAPAASGAGAPAAAAASGASGAPGRLPGYVVSSDGRVVLSGFGQCVRSGHWVPANAVEPCDLVAQASVPPPVVVTRAPEPQPEPAPAPIAQAAPAPAPAPLAAPEPPRTVIQKVTLSTDLLFEFNKSQLRDSGKEKLDELAANAKDAQVEEVVATGYADPIGSKPYNEKLSAERAAAVRDYLVQNGVASDKIKTEGRGETAEFTEGKCAKLTGQKLIRCFEPNRRVDVELLGSRQVAAGETPAAGGATASPATPGSPATR